MTSTPTPAPAHSEQSSPVRSVPSAAYPVAQRLLRPVRPRRPTTTDGRPTDRVAVAGTHLALLANHLTPRDRWLARVVAEHRVFTSTQLTQLAFGSPRTANQRLLQLYQWRVLDRFQPLLAVGSAPMHYVLDVAGAAVLAAEDGLDPADVGYRHDRALGIGHSLRLAHTLGINGLYAALVAIARHTSSHTDTDLDGRGGRAVTTWWPETRCARVWGDLARPDAYGRWHEDGRDVEFFLEYDTGTEPLTRVAGKLHDYARLAAATAITTPVLFWFPTPARESAARAALTSTLTALENPSAVPVATTAAHPARGAGDHTSVPDSPAAARWLPLIPGGMADVAPSSRFGANAARVRLARLTWPRSDNLTTAIDPDATALPDTTGAGSPVGLAEPEPMPPAGQSAYTTRPTPDTEVDGAVSDPRRRR
jgi:hypothetical protein